MQEKPRVGLILMRAAWPDSPEAQAILDGVRVDTQAILDRLNQHFVIQNPWVVDSPEALRACQEALRNSDLDMILLTFQTGAEDIFLTSLLPAIGDRPLLLWCYAAWRRLPGSISAAEIMRVSGSVGAFEALGTLRNLDVPFLFTFGAAEDPRLIDDLVVAGRAALVRKALRSARFGVIPSCNDRMQSTFVDEYRLMTDIGPRVVYVPVNDYKQAAEAVPQERVEAYLSHLTQHYPLKNVSPEGLERAARAALGLADLAQRLEIQVMTVNDDTPDLRLTFGLSPALYPSGPDLPEDRLFQPESDLGAATANYILHCLTGSPTMFLELWFWDEARNIFIGGHAGMQNPDLGEEGAVCLTPDEALCREGGLPGAQFQFPARTGRVTLFQLRSTPQGWQAIVATGVVLEGIPALEGYPYAMIRMDTTIAHALNRLAEIGATQHWIMAYGSVLHEIEAFCQMGKIPLEVLSY